MKKTQKKLNKKNSLSNAYRKKLFIGIFFIMFSFLCGAAIFYLLIDRQVQKEQILQNLQEEFLAVRLAKNLAEEKSEKLEDEVGRSLYLDKFIEKSDSLHGEEERSRRKGVLWIDRNKKKYIITLGVLNGLKQGDKLPLFDGEKEVGMVEVDTALDVISYVRPVGKTLQDFAEDYYRVRIIDE